MPGSPSFSRALAAVESLNWDLIESLRTIVTKGDLPEAAKFYETLDSWSKKAALIQLVQDRCDPVLDPVMRDFLAAPRGTDDTLWLSKLVAVLHLKRDLSGFTALYNQGPAAVDAEARRLSSG